MKKESKERIVFDDGLDFKCEGCGDEFPPYSGVPVPRLCPKCQAIEDNGGKVKGNGAGELCSRCSMKDTPFAPPGWLCPKCSGNDQTEMADMRAKVVTFAKTIDGLTQRNAELLIEKADAEQVRDEAVASRENWYERYQNVSEQTHDATKDACCKHVVDGMLVDGNFGWLCPSCHEGMAGWVEGMMAKRKALGVLLAKGGRELPKELKLLDLDGIVNSRPKGPTVITDLEVTGVSLTKEPFYKGGEKISVRGRPVGANGGTICTGGCGAVIHANPPVEKCRDCLLVDAIDARDDDDKGN